MATLATYLAFPGNTKEAMEHYRDVLGGELQLVTYGDMPAMDGMPFEPDAEAVAHAVLTLPEGVIAGSDSVPGETYAVRDTIYSLLYTADDVERAKRIIEQFVAAGGEINMPFELAPWGDHYGQVFDKFGVMWALSVEGQSA